ncbi:unnamed protein product [Protopolystoma xenopodis]|uniref:Protein kinase domain-containing protein n=1 Tax=Protopolystoma xenopodis TaxID=117903 RepID=A0A448WAE7_9PLAT|nr:unnamed protein product [Protopolystoma xenopodis]
MQYLDTSGPLNSNDEDNLKSSGDFDIGALDFLERPNSEPLPSPCPLLGFQTPISESVFAPSSTPPPPLPASSPPPLLICTLPKLTRTLIKHVEAATRSTLLEPSDNSELDSSTITSANLSESTISPTPSYVDSIASDASNINPNTTPIGAIATTNTESLQNTSSERLSRSSAPSRQTPVGLERLISSGESLSAEGFFVLADLGRGNGGLVTRSRHIASGFAVARKTFRGIDASRGQIIRELNVGLL